MNATNPFRDLGDGLKRQQREFRLQVACVEHLRSAFPTLLFFHVPNRGGSASDGHFKKMMGAVAGAPDLVVTWGDELATSVAAIELKAPGGATSSAQNKFLSSAAQRGWKTAVCWSVQQLHTCLLKWKIPPAHHGIREPDYRDKHEKFADAFDMYQP